MEKGRGARRARKQASNRGKLAEEENFCWRYLTMTSLPCLICGMGTDALQTPTNWGSASSRSLYIRTSNGVKTWAVICFPCLRALDTLDLTERTVFAPKEASELWDRAFPNMKGYHKGPITQGGNQKN